MAPLQTREESIPADTPTFPFEDICVDFFLKEGMSYIAFCDCYSGFLTVHKPLSTDLKNTAKFMRSQFERFGVPKVVKSNGGLPFNSVAWRAFLKRWGIRHRMSSAYYPESNSRAEIRARVAKRVIAKNTKNCNIDRDEVTRAVLQYLNSPLTGLTESPAKIVYIK